MVVFAAASRPQVWRMSRLLMMMVVPIAPVAARAALTVTPLTWNVIGLDSNNPASGPKNFPVGARICSDVATTNVNADFFFDSANANINLRPGSLSSLNFASIGAGSCIDAYFEVEVTQTAAAFDTTRRFHITGSDVSGTYSTPTPRELYVEHLISQSRNSITDIKFGTSPPPGLTSVPAGGAMNLVVGNSYYIQLLGGTATQGYQQFDDFINFSNAVFQILSVDTTYSADTSPYVPNPNDKLYADACLWENDPNSPNYRSCIGGSFNAGGNNVVTTYHIKIVSGGGTSQTLSTLLHDFSGSSFHYNGDFSVGARVANIIDPASANISKSFSPNPASINGISVLTINLTNPNAGALSGYSFVDNLPANLVVATPNGATTSGCGTPSLTATAGSSSISFANGTVAANGNCVIKVNVTPTATGSLVNTTNDLFINGIDTGHTATATLTVNTSPPPGTGLCGISLAGWSVPNGTVANPPDLAGGLPTVKAGNVATATLAANVPGSTSINTSSGHVDTTSWSTFGYKNGGQFIQFTVDTSQYTGVQMSFWVANPSPANGPTQINVTANSGSGFGAPVLTVNSPAAAFTQHTIDFTGLTNAGGNTLFRIAASGANNDASGASLLYDDMVFTGCTTPVQPTISKAFAPSSIALNAVSTLTFALTNSNSAALTGAAFSDALPGGVQVAATPAAATTCGGTWSPAAGNTSLSFSGGTIPANSSCTVSVNVTATTAGPHANVSGFLSTTESGTNPSSVGSATLTALSPPQIAKLFSPSPILAGGTSTLTFTITNPNPNDAMAGVAFSDTFPTTPGLMTVASTPNAATSGCGAPTFTPAGGAGSIAFSNGSIAAGGTCSVSVDVTAPAVGTYNNTSGVVSFVLNAQTVNGNAASDSLAVSPPSPSIGLLKQVSLNPTGPWTTFVAVTSAAPVYYQFTIENTGDVPLSPISLTDNTLNVSTCNATLASTTLPVAVAANNNHIVTCVVGPVATASGSVTNTAHSTGTFNSAPVDSPDSSATYATAALTLAKSVTESSYTLPGDVLHYSYLVTNSGFAPLQGPVTVTDDKATVTCPAVNTVGDLDNFLDPGESMTCTATYTITASDVSNASVTNTASATVDGVTSNTDARTVPLSTSADVSIDKTLSTAGPYSAGQSISYTLTIANAGPSTATAIQVTDTPTNLTITNVSGSGCSALPCTIPSLAVGANTQVFVTATINASGTFDNSATVSAAQPDPDPSNNTDNTGNGGFVGTSADVSVDKTLVTAGPYTVGQSLSYTLFVANAGPSTATNVQVTDTPTNLTITNVSGGGCAALPCTIASLASGANVTINVTATINASGAFDNSSTVSATEPDPNVANNTDNTGNGGNAAASADVSVNKTLVTAGPYTVGQSLGYTLFVANAGPSTATNVQVTDTPTNLTITNVSGGGCAALPCTIASLASGANATINVTATINASGAFDNSSTVSATEPDPNLANNTDNTGNGGNAGASADVSVNKTLVTAGPYSQGQVLSYTLVVANAGPSTATNVQVTDTPTHLTITNVSGGGCAALPCTIASLASGANVTINVTATINAVGAFDNSSTVSATEPDPNLANNTDNTGNGGNAAASADVSVNKTLVTAGPYSQGQALSYTLVVANAGPSTATNVQVTDTPTNLTITNVSGGGCAALPCTIASLASGANATINVTATINASGAFDNSSTVSATEPDPNPANNTDNTGNGGTTGPSADVSVSKTLVTSGPYTPGQALSYTLVVANAGPSTATNVQVTDTPTNLTITNVSGGGCAALPCTIASLASGANATINVTATINASGAFDNSSTVSATEPDPNPANNTDNTGNGGSTSAPQLTVTKVASPSQFTVGVPASYDITVANTGSAATSGAIVVSDVLPTGITLASSSGTNWSCVGTTSLTCTFSGTLAVSANTTLTLNVSVGANATNGNNTATASGGGDNSCPAAAHCSSVVPVAVVAPQLSTSKAGVLDNSVVAPTTQSNPGDTIAYTITVANSGNGAASAVTVTDALLPSLSCKIGASTVALPTTLNAGASLICTEAYTLTNADVAAGSVSNTVTTSAGNVCNPSTAGSTCSATTVTPLTLVPVLTASKVGVLNNAVVPPNNQSDAGDQIDYTITVSNSGNGPATGVAIADGKLPALTCMIGGNPATLPATIAAGATLTCTGTYTLTSADINAGSVTNTATASGSNACQSGCTGTEVTPLGTVPILAVTKTATPNPFVVGQTASYAITVANNGSAATTAPITVSDTLPNGIAFASAAGANWTCAGTNSLTCTFSGTLNVAASTTLTVNVTVSSSATTGNNTANASGGGDSTCPAAARCSATVPVTITAPQLTVSKTATPTSFVVGQSASYAITVVNSGSAPTFGNITVTDALPTGITLASASGSNWSCTGTTSLTCTFAGTLAVGANTVLTLNVNVAAAATTGSNTATAGGGGDSTCPAAPHCSATVSVPIGTAGSPQLTVSKSAAPNPFVVGVPAHYAVTVTNTGTASTVGSVLLTDTLPGGIALVSGNGANWSCAGTTALSCSFNGTLAPSTSTVLTLNVSVSAAATTGTNTATASGGNDSTCPAASRCSGTVPVNVVRPPPPMATPVNSLWTLCLLALSLLAIAAARRRDLAGR